MGYPLDRIIDRLASERHEISRDNSPYLTRWVLWGTRYKSVQRYTPMLHRFHRSDADEMHDHPWPFVSIILSGGYWERTPALGWKDGSGPTKLRWYGPGRVLARPANWIHSVVLPPGRSALTLVIRGRRQRSWGFYCPSGGYVDWRTHLARHQATGSGCGTEAQGGEE